jgi:RNA polymerase sigma-70 factor (ECF subfamily)
MGTLPETADFSARLSRGRTGDPAAQEQLFAAWRPLLRLQARRLLGRELSGRVDPSDVVQEALTQAFHDLDRFRGQSEGEWVGWLKAIVAGQAAKARRHHHAARRAVGGERPLADAAAAQPGPEAQALGHEAANRLAAALEQLPEPYREVLLRRVFLDEPFDAVAQAVGRSPGATRVLWTRGLRRLRDLLEPS